MARLLSPVDHTRRAAVTDGRDAAVLARAVRGILLSVLVQSITRGKDSSRRK